MTIRDPQEALAAMHHGVKFGPDAVTLVMIKDSARVLYGIEWPDLPWEQAVNAVLTQRIEYWNDRLRRGG